MEPTNAQDALLNTIIILSAKVEEMRTDTGESGLMSVAMTGEYADGMTKEERLTARCVELYETNKANRKNFERTQRLYEQAVSHSERNHRDYLAFAVHLARLIDAARGVQVDVPKWWPCNGPDCDQMVEDAIKSILAAGVPAYETEEVAS